MDVSATDGNKRWSIGEITTSDQTSVTLDFEVIGTAPIERIDIFDGLDLVHAIRPWGEQSAGDRLRVTCAGQHYRGRGRLVKWDVQAAFDHGRIEKIKPINFGTQTVNPTVDDRHAEWKTVTGGASSVDFFGSAAWDRSVDVNTNFDS